MAKNDSKTESKIRSDSKSKSDYESNDWRYIFSGAFHSFGDRGYTANLLVGIAIMLGSPACGYILNTKTGAIYGAASAITLLAWIIAFKLAAEVPKKSDTSEREHPATTDNIVSQAGGGNIDAPNNSGNINTGSVSGNLDQSVINLGSRPRVLSAEQKSELIDIFNAHTDSKLRIIFVNSNAEVTNFANQLAEAAKASKIQVDVQFMYALYSNGPPTTNLELRFRDKDNPPSLHNPLGNALLRMGFRVAGKYFSETPDTDWPESEKDLEVIFVGERYDN